MKGLMNVNRFPAGNIGGLVTQPATPSNRKRVVSLFMPPLNGVEIKLAISGLPSSAMLSTNNCPLVIVFRGNGASGRWELRIATKNTDGTYLWAPFSYGNIHEDAHVCWGTGNPTPETFAEMLNAFFGSPFNADLGVQVPELNYKKWEAEQLEKAGTNHSKERAEVVGFRAYNRWNRYGNDGVNPVVRNKRPLTIASEVANHLTSKINRLRGWTTQWSHIRDRVRSKGRDACATAGKAWVAINDKQYMRVLKIIERVNKKYTDCSNMSEDLINCARAYEEFTNVRIEGFRTRFEQNLIAGERGDVRRRMAQTTQEDEDRKRLYHDDRYSNHKMFAQARDRFLEEMKKFGGLSPLHIAGIRKWVLSYYQQSVANIVDTLTSGRLRQQWHDHLTEYTANYRKAHYCDNKWLNTLEFRDMMRSLAPWGDTVPFPSCEGMVSLHHALNRNTALPLSRDFFRFVSNELGYYIEAETVVGFFKSVTPKVKMVFWPGIEKIYLTNGITLKEVTNETLAKEAAVLEETTVEIDILDFITNLYAAQGNPPLKNKGDNTSMRQYSSYDRMAHDMIRGWPNIGQYPPNAGPSDQPIERVRINLDRADNFLTVEEEPTHEQRINFDGNCTCHICSVRCACQQCWEDTDSRCNCRACVVLRDTEDFFEECVA